VGYFTTLSVSGAYKTDDKKINELEPIWRKRLRPNQAKEPAFARRDREKLRKPSVMPSNVFTEIRSQYLQNTSYSDEPNRSIEQEGASVHASTVCRCEAIHSELCQTQAIAQARISARG
jgi:hypothetical protein